MFAYDLINHTSRYLPPLVHFLRTAPKSYYIIPYRIILAQIISHGNKTKQSKTKHSLKIFVVLFQNLDYSSSILEIVSMKNYLNYR